MKSPFAEHPELIGFQVDLQRWLEGLIAEDLKVHGGIPKPRLFTFHSNKSTFFVWVAGCEPRPKHHEYRCAVVRHTAGVRELSFHTERASPEIDVYDAGVRAAISARRFPGEALYL